MSGAPCAALVVGYHRYEVLDTSDLLVEADGEFPRLTLRREGVQTELRVKTLDASVALKDKTITVTANSLKLEQPALSLAGPAEGGMSA